MFADKFLRTILLVCFVAVIALPVYTVFFVYPSFTGLLAENTEDTAVRVATHLMNTTLSENIELRRDSLQDNFSRDAALLQKDFGLMKIQVFSSSGEVVYSTDPNDIGKINKERYFREIVARGNTHTNVVRKDTKSLDGQIVTTDVVETYVPLMRGAAFAGAFEVYFDVSDTKTQIDGLISRSHAILFMIALALLTAVVISSVRANRDISARKRTEQQLLSQSSELEMINSELSALYEVSSAVSQTLDMDKLLSAIMDAVTRLKIVPVERKGGIFLIEGRKMRLISRLGHSDAFLEFHKETEIGDCLCGITAKTGEILVSGNSQALCRHTASHPEVAPHEHLCIPLKAANRMVGVLFLYLPPGAHLDEGQTKLLLAIGNQIGISMENARLYEETKKLSLLDPLTGLANRRLMNIVLERSIAEAKRYKTAISAIMLDIDFFKQYNDTHGHVAGDKLLVDIGKIISQEVRDTDLVVRYGGEEFLLVLTETDLMTALDVAERIRKTIGKEKGVTVSLGVSAYEKGMQQEELIRRADAALYRAKQSGRNRTQLYERG